jgi:hypothetical protein
MYLVNEAKAWVKRRTGPDEVIRIRPEADSRSEIISYKLYTAYKGDDYLGQILFDKQGYWIYDGEVFSIAEQEQLAKFIISHEETL